MKMVLTMSDAVGQQLGNNDEYEKLRNALVGAMEYFDAVFMFDSKTIHLRGHNNAVRTILVCDSRLEQLPGKDFKPIGNGRFIIDIDARHGLREVMRSFGAAFMRFLFLARKKFSDIENGKPVDPVLSIPEYDMCVVAGILSADLVDPCAADAVLNDENASVADVRAARYAKSICFNWRSFARDVAGDDGFWAR